MNPELAFIAVDFSSAFSSLPAADRPCLVGLSVPDIQAWIAAKADEYRRYTLALCTMQNALAPIHRLPADVLSAIFVDAWQNRNSLWLSHVCRRWRSLLLDTSQFWAVAIAADRFRLSTTDSDDDPDDEDYLAAACLRSAPRDISLHFSSLSSGNLQLAQNSGRIVSIDVSFKTNNQLKWLWEAFDAGMSRLTDLSIHLHRLEKGPLTLEQLSTEMLPVLTRLNIPSTLLDRFRLDTIRELSLRWDGKSHGRGERITQGNLNVLLGMLQCYPRLTSLDISDDTLSWREQPQPDSLVFQALQRLRVKSRMGVVSSLVPRLTFPATTHVDFEISPDAHPEPSVHNQGPTQGNLFTVNSSLDAVVSLVDYVTIRPRPVPTIHGYLDGLEHLRISFTHLTPSLQQDIINLFTRNTPPVTHLIVTEAEQHIAENTRYCTKSAFDPNVLSAFPHVTHANFVLSRTPMAFFKSLSRLQSPLAVAADAVPSLRSLKELTMGFPILRRGLTSRELRRNDGAVPNAAHWFGEWCKVIAEVLTDRDAQGRRLSRLTFFGYEDGCMAENPPPVSYLDLAAVDPEFVQSSLKPIGELVDGPVVFMGYRFFTR